MTAYEVLRQRHVADAAARAPEMIERLRWSADRLAAHRQAELRRLVRHAQSVSAWHRARLADVDADHLDESRLAELPVMTKADLMSNFDTIVTDQRLRRTVVEPHLDSLTDDAYLLDRYHACAYGGSSGQRGIFVYDWDAWTDINLGISRGLARDMASWPARGHQTRMAVVAAGRATHLTYSGPRTFSDNSMETYPIPVTKPFPDIVAALNQARPDVVLGYPSMLHLLATAPDLRINPRTIITSSEPLLPETRDLLEATWSVPVINWYACSEVGMLAGGCVQGPGLHVADDLVLVEPVDESGTPVPPGRQAAKMYVTGLVNHIQPLIRYELDDEVFLVEGSCPCGSAYRRIADPLGRADDMFVYGETVVHPHVFRTALAHRSEVVEYQVKQTADGSDVEVRFRDRPDIPDVRAALIEALVGVRLSDPQITVREVAAVARPESGKLRRFVALPVA